MIPERYKQTEKGIIPEDWALHNFGEKVTVLRGGSPRPITAYLTKSNEGINWIKIGDVKPGEKYINSTEEKIIPEGASRSRVVHKGDFILSNSMSFGRPYILNIDGCIHDGWLTIQNYSETFNKNYLYYVLSSTEVFKQYVTMAAGSSVQNLNKDKVSKLLVVAPEVIREQEKIAEALSDTDDLISSLEKLIEKKKAIKQGAMQNLLTGKTRLPGFTGEWEVEIMKKYLTFQVGYPFHSCYFNKKGEGMRLVKNRDLKADDQLNYTIEKVGRKFMISNGDVLISMDGDFLPCLWSKGDALLNQRVGKIKVSEKMDLMFAYYCLQKPLSKLQEGTGATTVKHLSHTDVEKMKILIPIEVKEQFAIANILSDMDKEIEQLERKLAKARLIKQGMMQQLLTGKIRLV